MRFLVAIFIFPIVSLQVKAQSFTIYNYSIAEGLPSSEVYEVYQDKRGFLWFATDNGVVKFDGSQMETFHAKDGLTDPVVFSFYEDPKDRLWFRTFSGQLCYYQNERLHKYIHNDKLATLKVTGIFSYIVTEKDEIWYTCRDEFGKIDAEGNITAEKIDRIGFFYRSLGNEFLLGNSSNHLPVSSIIIDDKEFPVTLVETIYLNRVLRAVKWKNKIYLSLNREVFEYDGEKLTKVINSQYPVINLSLDNEENLWVGYMNGGAERFNLNNFSEKWQPDFLKTKSVTKVIQDHEGGLWFSTLENGVYHVPNLLIEHFPLPSTSRIRGVLCLSDKILAGDQAGNLFKLDGTTKKASVVTTVEGSILTLFSNNNKIFISTNAGVHIYDHQLQFLKKFGGIVNDFVKDKNGYTWAFGGYKLSRFDKDGNQAILQTANTPYRAIHMEDSLFFLADRTGLHIRDKNFKLITIHKAFSDVKISDIHKFNDSTLLITTIGKGFILMNSRTLDFKIFNSENNFIADHIFSSLVANRNLWLGTEKGLIKLPVDQLYRPTASFDYLTEKSGLISDKIGFLLAVDNAVWAFSDNTFSVIPFSFSMFANKKPLFYIREIKVNEQSAKAENIPLLKHTENNIQITFGFISFNNQNILLRYRLSAKDNWIYTNSKQLQFTSLAPGQYAFDLEYSTDNIQWLSAMAPLDFTITQPWWAKWYIQLIAFLTLLILIFFYFRYQQSIYRQRHHYLKIINEHQQKLILSEVVTRERERNRISKELHDRVGTNLTAIKLTVNQLLKNYKEPLAGDIEEQFQIAITEIKEIIYGLTPPSLERYGLFTGLKNYIGKLTRTIPFNIALKTYGKDTHGYELNIMVFRILQELISNTIKHSFAKNITIHINAFDDMLNIVYEDDGIGFSYDPEQSGLGLDNIESRIQSINGTLKFESGTFGISYTIDIPVTLNNDLYDTNDTGRRS